MELGTAVAAYVEDSCLANKSHRTITTIQTRLKPFTQKHQGKRIDKITKEDVLSHFVDLKNKNLAEATLAGHRSTHQAFWKWCKKQKLIKKNPSKGIKKYKYTPVVRQAAPQSHVDEVYKNLWNYVYVQKMAPVSIRSALFCSLFMDGGGRLGEYHSLTVKNLVKTLENPILTDQGINAYQIVGTGKTGTAPLVFFDQSADLAALWLNRTPFPQAKYVFHSTRDGSHMRVNSLARAPLPICKFAGVPPFRSHAVRKRNVTEIIRQSGNVNIGKTYANHRKLETTLTHYDTVMRDEVINTAANLAASRLQRTESDEINRLFRGK